jgi:hypothetical protein
MIPQGVTGIRTSFTRQPVTHKVFQHVRCVWMVKRICNVEHMYVVARHERECICCWRPCMVVVVASDRSARPEVEQRTAVAMPQ